MTVTRPKIWPATLLLTFSTWAFCFALLSFRRDWAVNLYLFNKTMACLALILLVLSVSLSALAYFRPALKGLLAYRREVGLMCFAAAILHIVLSLFVQNPATPGSPAFPFPDYFLDHAVAFLSALFGLIIIGNAFRLSFNRSHHAGTPEKAKTWRSMLRLNYFAVVFILIHMVLLKYEGWFKWFDTLTPWMPPLSLVVFTFLIPFVLLKITQLTRENRIL